MNLTKQPWQTFSPEYARQAVVTLAADPEVKQESGHELFLEVPALAREYGFNDVDGRRPYAPDSF